MATAEDFKCFFSKPEDEIVTIFLSNLLPDEPTKEKSMNTYTITGRAYYNETFTVEAECEEDAKHDVEYGNVECDDREFEYVEDLEVVDVEYGDVERYGKLGVTFVTRGNIDESKIQDALYSLLMKFDGTTVDYDGGELELVGFGVDSIEEV